MKYTAQLDHHRLGYAHIEKFNCRVLIGWEQGLAKSYLPLLWRRRNVEEATPTVVVCLPGLKGNWQREARTHFRMRSYVLNGERPQKISKPNAQSLIIVGYNILPFWVERIRELNPKLVVIDETQAIKERSSARYKATEQLCIGVPNIIGLSGTIIVNRPREVWTIAHILWGNQNSLFRYFRPFADKFCQPKLTRFGWDYNGATNLDELNRLLVKHGYYRLLKKDTEQGIEEIVHKVIPITLENREEYDEAENDFVRWLHKFDTVRAGKAKKAKELAKTTYLKQLIAQLKFQTALEWIEEHRKQEKGKIVLFAVHKKVIERLQEFYGSRCLIIDGSIPTQDRLGIIERFEKDRKIDTLIGNIQAMGTGHSIRGASDEYFFELGYTPGEHSQAAARLHGINRGIKGKQTRAFYLVVKDTIEERLCRLIQKKQKILNATLDGDTEATDFNILDELLSEYRRRRIR